MTAFVIELLGNFCDMHNTDDDRFLERNQKKKKMEIILKKLDKVCVHESVRAAAAAAGGGGAV